MEEIAISLTDNSIHRIANILCQEGWCGTYEEACAILEAALVSQELPIVNIRSTNGGEIAKDASSDDLSTAKVTDILHETLRDPNPRFIRLLKDCMEEYFDINEEDAERILVQASLVVPKANMIHSSPERKDLSVEDFSDGELDDGVNDSEDSDDDDDDDETDIIGEGECEVCERYMKLTHHHLIPKSTWPRVSIKLATAITRSRKMSVGVGGSAHTSCAVGTFVGEEFAHLLPSQPMDDAGQIKSYIKTALRATCCVCRPCHDAIHKRHDNMTLALNFNTLEKLLSDERILAFGRWAHKQRTGKYTVRR